MDAVKEINVLDYATGISCSGTSSQAAQVPTPQRCSTDQWPASDQVGSGELFLQLVEHIRAHGYEANFYSRKLTYFDEDGFTYWTMGAPVAQTTIINRCRKENTFEERQKAGTLPD